MDNKIEIFKNEQFGEVRTILEGEKVLFCAADVAKALGYTNPNKAVNDHCRAITKRSTPISGKVQSINFIPEGDVYRLIIRSKLPAAEKFELECRFIEYQNNEYGCGVIGKVVNVTADESVMVDGKIDMSKVNAIAFDPYTHGYYKVTERVGEAFRDGLKLKK